MHAKACDQDVDGPVAGGDSFFFSAGVVRAHVGVRVGCMYRYNGERLLRL